MGRESPLAKADGSKQNVARGGGVEDCEDEYNSGIQTCSSGLVHIGHAQNCAAVH